MGAEMKDAERAALIRRALDKWPEAERIAEIQATASIECGQRLWQPSSWRRPLWRTFPRGFAVGPVMIFWRKR